MKVGFVHSHIFQLCGNAVYSNGKLPYRTWDRYLRYFDNITVMARSNHCLVSECSQQDLSSGPNVNFVWLPYLNNIRRYCHERHNAKKIMSECISNLDGVIIRMSNLGWLAAAECERQKKPWAVEVVGDAWDAYWHYGSLKGKIFAPIALLQARRWIGKAKFAMYVTQCYLQKRYPCHGITTAISNVEIVEVDDSVMQWRFENYRKLQDHSIRIWKVGLIGSLVNHYKGLHVAIKALRRLRDKGVVLHLHVLGHGKLDDWIESAKKLGVADLLHLDGTLPSGDSVIQWLDDLDIYIQPSFQEGLPRALIEAMSRGLPALASTSGGIPELLPPECLHEPGDDEKLALDMIRMMSNPAWKIQQASRNFVEAKKYNKEVIDDLRNVFWARFSEYVRECAK